MACEAPWDLGSVILPLYLLSFGSEVTAGGGVCWVLVEEEDAATFRVREVGVRHREGR